MLRYNYDFYEVAPLESEDFITATLPDLLKLAFLQRYFQLYSGSGMQKKPFRFLKNQGFIG